ncbi:uncharacterized protein FMAN_07313 [Fusarium mangiferae]|uniref:C2H2-type domain-containing protein n=1 Tax=Fusarium mangiferae TaxID=192010 RepID=A0A1L7TB08_FUSMA|nr:uncharacterized protein FMAN_07313 [Fusarium mangiferae]CVK92417.1 uncharacterized protein FMAN_07313 [Fusarium mangiferae]
MDHICHTCAEVFRTNRDLHAHIIEHKLALTDALRRCILLNNDMPPGLLDVLRCLSHSIGIHTCPNDGCNFESPSYKALEQHWRTHVPCKVRCGFCRKVANRVSHALNHHKDCDQRPNTKIAQNESSTRSKLSQYSSQALTEALPLLARPVKKRRITKRKRNPSNRKGTRDVGFEAELDIAREPVDSDDEVDYANDIITIPSSSTPLQERAGERVSPGAERNNRLIDEYVLALTPVQTGVLGTFPPPPVSHISDFQAPGLYDRPCDGVGTFSTLPVSHLDLQAPRLPDQPYGFAATFPSLSALHSFQLNHHNNEMGQSNLSNSCILPAAAELI